ncbi:COX15/CtaA family protein [Endozoicomonas sp. Mp262]|uniref:COX15/CtaA family protein n=1 Tax=Endozoicomonas sp. Mp262 TaxID=2919499 RepID=UPI0021D9C601
MPANKKNKKGYYLALAATFLAFIVVGVGAYTRLVHAGLGCPDWPGCYGFLTVPESKEAIETAENRFPDAPVDIAKGWAEMGHRYIAGLLMILVLVLTVQTFRHRRNINQPWLLPLFILGLISLQAVFGMWTVTLKLWPQVVTAHLLGGFATLSLLFLLTLRLSDTGWIRLPSTWRLGRLKGLALISLLAVIVQITLGGWTSSNYAALACPDLPTCQGVYWPDMNFQKGFDIGQSIGPNYLGGQLDSDARTAIHMGHRIGAIIVFGILLFMLFAAKEYAKGLASDERQSVQQLSFLILLALVLQLTLGISNIIWHLPLFIAVAHNLGGALLLLSLVAFNYRLSALVERDG